MDACIFAQNGMRAGSLSHGDQAPPPASRGDLHAKGNNRKHRPTAMKKNSRGYHQAARGSHRVFVAECPLSGIFSMNNGSNLERYFNGVRVRSFVLTGAPATC
jgi:hypothetical protein